MRHNPLMSYKWYGLYCQMYVNGRSDVLQTVTTRPVFKQQLLLRSLNLPNCIKFVRPALFLYYASEWWDLIEISAKASKVCQATFSCSVKSQCSLMAFIYFCVLTMCFLVPLFFPFSALIQRASRICWPTCRELPCTVISSTFAARWKLRSRIWVESSSCLG